MNRRDARQSGFPPALCRLGLPWLLAALFAPPAFAGQPPLAAWQWSARILLVFAPPGNSAALQSQRRLLANDSASAERDLLRVEVLGDQVAAFPAASELPDAEALRRHYRVEPHDFEVLLIGKDGGVKLRQSAPVEACELYRLIDGMPMRRRESHEAGGAAEDPCAGQSK